MTPQLRGILRALLTAEQVAEYAGCSTRTILCDYAAGKLRGRKFNSRRIRFTPTDVEAYLNGYRR